MRCVEGADKQHTMIKRFSCLVQKKCGFFVESLLKRVLRQL